MQSVPSRIDRMEGSARLLSLIKLTNVALTMVWGFAVTFVFIRILPLGEFQAFLLLIAFSNFTISAEFGFTSIIYDRLRRFFLSNSDSRSTGDFRREELGVLLGFLLALILVSATAIAIALLTGVIRTGMPLLFMLFFLFSCLNVISLLAKRALAALDQNVYFEAIDLCRRVLCTGLLLAVLGGLDVFVSVLLQFGITVVAVLIALHRIHVRLAMTWAHWVALRVGGGHIRRHYLRDVRASVLFTISEISAYNLPYFTIAAATKDVVPMLLFDFAYKIMRSLSMIIRATVESVLPKITHAFHAAQHAEFRRRVLYATMIAAGLAASASIVLMLVGQHLAKVLFDGNASITELELGALCLLLLALSVICVSVYVQMALGRFSMMLRQSLVLLAGSVISVPAALTLTWRGGASFGSVFLIMYAFAFVIGAALHARSVYRLTNSADGVAS